MSVPDGFSSTLLGVAAAAAIGTALGVGASARADVRAELEALAQRTILFGHQSVGMNVLDGVVQLAAEHGVMLRVVDVSRGATPLVSGTFGHAFVGANGDPALKLEGFARAISAPSADAAEIALVKFCYVDFREDSDVGALFAAYERTLAKLRSARPGITFVHVTTPLTTIQTGPKAWAKRLLGRTPYGLAENARREEFNALLRRAYGGREPIFDLARVESTRPDGGTETAEWNGRAVPALAPEYSDDGGHLNRDGQRRAAQELVAVLAGVPKRPR